jgi:tetratricopeptide (TPR) repeat protein
MDGCLAGQQMIDIAIVGNSNSIIHGSFARVLAATPGLRVDNRSIGGTPNVVLLDFLTHSPRFDYDFILVETAVVDYIQSAGSYTRERSKQTLEIFLRTISAVSRAKIIFVIVPTRPALLRPHENWQEEVYLEVADAYGIPVLNGFDLIRQMIGTPKMRAVKFFTEQADALVSTFRLPRSMADHLAWRELRDVNRVTNALGVYAFTDDGHVSPTVFAVFAQMLTDFIRQEGPVPNSRLASPGSVAPAITAVMPVADGIITRASSLMTRRLVPIVLGKTAVYPCPPGYLAYGIMVNQAAASGLLKLTSPAGTAILDVRKEHRVKPWEGIVVPMLDPVGGGPVSVSLTNSEADIAVARRYGGSSRPVEHVVEIGEMLLLRDTWQSDLPELPPATEPAPRLERRSGSEQMMHDAGAPIDVFVRGVEGDRHILDLTSFGVAAELLATGIADTSLADRARMLLAIGATRRLTSLLDSPAAQQADDKVVTDMKTALFAARTTNAADLLAKAMDLAQAGKDAEADAVFERGMGLFPSDLRFFIHWAWMPYHRRDWSKSIERWTLIKEAFSGHKIGFLGLATALQADGQLEAAEALLTKTMKRFPNDADVSFSYASSALDLRQKALGLERLKDLRDRHPAHRRGRLLLISTALEMGNYDLARGDVERLLAFDAAAPMDDLIAQAVDIALRTGATSWLRDHWGNLTGRVDAATVICARLSAMVPATDGAALPDFVAAWVEQHWC